MPVPLIDNSQNLRVLAAELLRLGREQLLTNGHDLAALNLGLGHVYQPVAGMRLARTAIPHRRQVLHFLGILFVRCGGSLRSSASTVSC